MKGSVKFFNDKKGFGFIGVEGKEEDIFVHFSAIEGNGFKKLLQNDNVEFEIVEENGKKRASKVRVIE